MPEYMMRLLSSVERSSPSIVWEIRAKQDRLEEENVILDWAREEITKKEKIRRLKASLEKEVQDLKNKLTYAKANDDTFIKRMS
jgi:hypothetical protein